MRFGSRHFSQNHLACRHACSRTPRHRAAARSQASKLDRSTLGLFSVEENGCQQGHSSQMVWERARHASTEHPPSTRQAGNPALPPSQAMRIRHARPVRMARELRCQAARNDSQSNVPACTGPRDHRDEQLASKSNLVHTRRETATRRYQSKSRDPQQKPYGLDKHIPTESPRERGARHMVNSLRAW
jgi:hypothetical protein